MKKNLILAFALTIITTFSVNHLQAQTFEDVVKVFNEAVDLSKTDNAGSVVKMQAALTMCTTVGKEADSIKIKITTVLPVFQYNAGNDLVKEKKYDDAILAFEKSNEFAIKFEDINIKEKSQSQLLKLYSNKGITYQKNDNSDSAIMFLDKALKIDAEQSKVLYYRGLAYKKKGDSEKMKESMELAIATSSKSNDTITLKAAKNAIGQSIYQDGKAAFLKKAYNDAITKLNSALSYDYKNKELFYMLAASYNNLKNFDAAIEASTSGLAMEEQTNDKMARFYYEIAKAYEGKKDNANACDNYKKAAFGTFAQSANYQIKTVLKCK